MTRKFCICLTKTLILFNNIMPKFKEFFPLQIRVLNIHELKPTLLVPAEQWGILERTGAQRPSSLVEILPTFITWVSVGRSCDLGRPLFMGPLKGTEETVS